MKSPSQINLVFLPHGYHDKKAESEILRLESLQVAPEAYTSSYNYKHENQFTEDVCRQRLENPHVQYMIAVQKMINVTCTTELNRQKAIAASARTAPSATDNNSTTSDNMCGERLATQVRTGA